MTNKKQIFTFWEPKDNIYPYIELCLDTWKKSLNPDYEIIVLDYDNLFDYIPKEAINPKVFKYASMAQISDAISVAVLLYNGGIYVDADTIIYQKEIPSIELLNKTDLLMFNNGNIDKLYLAFIAANKNSKILKSWLNEINLKFDKLPEYPIVLKKILKLFINFIPIRRLRKRIKSKMNIQLEWDLVGNSIINKLAKTAQEKDFISMHLDGYIFEELLENKDGIKIYNDFYFSNKYSLEDFYKKTIGFTALQNSWTIKDFKLLSKKDLLNTDILLAKVFNDILK